MREMFKLLRLCRPYMGWMILGVLAALVTVLANIGLMAMSGWFIASMALAGVAGVSMNYFTPGATIRALAIIRTAGRYAERLLTHEATFRLTAHLRQWFYERIEPLAPAVLSDYRSGDVLSRIGADINVLERFYISLFVPFCTALLAIIILTIILLFYWPPLAFVIGSALLLTGFIVPICALWIGHKTSARLSADMAALQTEVNEQMQGLGEALLYGQEGRHHDHLISRSSELTVLQDRLNRTDSWAQGFIVFTSGITLLLVLLLALPAIHNQILEKPDLAMIALLTLAAFEVTVALPTAFAQWGRFQNAARRIFTLVEQAPLISEPVNPSILDENNVETMFSLSLRNVNFSYPARCEPALQNFNLEIKAGEAVALIGSSGAGKSSLINLLMRFYEAQAGDIILNGRALKDYKLDNVRHAFSVVPQDPHIFMTSLAENLRLACPEATQDVLEAACKKAQIHDFIQSLPAGYDTYAGAHGLALSGGQRRRLALARAFLKDAPCLILDEPGEGLDYEMEKQLLDDILTNRGPKTVILMTHRTTGLEHIDRIVRLD